MVATHTPIWIDRWTIASLAIYLLLHNAACLRLCRTGSNCTWTDWGSTTMSFFKLFRMETHQNTSNSFACERVWCVSTNNKETRNIRQVFHGRRPCLIKFFNNLTSLTFQNSNLEFTCQCRRIPFGVRCGQLYTHQVPSVKTKCKRHLITLMPVHRAYNQTQYEKMWTKFASKKKIHYVSVLWIREGKKQISMFFVFLTRMSRYFSGFLQQYRFEISYNFFSSKLLDSQIV
jgi:hypothetical protein